MFEQECIFALVPSSLWKQCNYKNQVSQNITTNESEKELLTKFNVCKNTFHYKQTQIINAFFVHLKNIQFIYLLGFCCRFLHFSWYNTMLC